MKRQKRNLTVDILLGAAAGAGATWIMDKVTTALYEQQSKEVRDKEDEVRGEKTAFEIAAERSAQLLGRKVTEEQRKQIGNAIHWSLGVSSGALYGALRNSIPRFGIGSGLAYGTVFWLAMDEAALTLLGLTPPPQDFPWQTHARGFAGHLVLGGVIESLFDVTDLLTR